ncbi:glutathione hydrolase 1 proenzyme-like [Glandiceps talaboti]
MVKSRGVSKRHVIAIGLSGFVFGIGVGLLIVFMFDDCSFSRCDSPEPIITTTVMVTEKAELTTEQQKEELTTEQSDKYFFKTAAVAVDNGVCSEVARDILLDGGNAVDAAIAGLLCCGIVNSYSSGIGGGHFMTIYNRESGKVEIVDSREEAPSGATATMYTDDPRPDASTYGGFSVGVPGEIDGFWKAHTRHGQLPWKDLFEPAIKLAERGFTVGPALANAIQFKQKEIREMEGLSEIFLHENGTLKLEGDIMYQHKLAQTYREIANGGPEVFYTGRLADDIVADIQDHDGIITKDDMRNYRAKLKEPLKIKFDGYTVYSPPPPSSGAVISLILNILKGYNFDEESIENNNMNIVTYHRIVEAFKFAYAKRSLLGDQDYVDIEELLYNMTSSEYAESLRMKIDDDRTHNYTYYGPSFSLEEDAGTSHISAVDQYGNAVSVTSTTNLHFGSKVRGLRTGIIFNNEMDDFSSPNISNYWGVPPSESNFIEPGKRPMSSMAPTIVVDEDGDVQLVVGSSGGTKITTTSSLVTARTLWFGDDIKDAVSKPRFHHQLIPQRVDYESGIDEEIINGLEGFGHKTNVVSKIAVSNGIRRTKDGLEAYSDDRKGGGFPAGF